MADKKLTDIKGIGEKTAEKLRRRLSRSTGRLGSDVTVGEAARSEAVTKSVLAADQQRALAEAEIGFTPERDARQRGVKSSDTDQTQTDTITRGDFRVKKQAIRDARDTFDELSDERQREDKNDREPVVTDIDVWTGNISRFDFPGIDTPSQRKVRADPTDSVLNHPSGQSGDAGQLRPRENWRESRPEPTETQLALGEEPDKADAKRTGIYRASDGRFVERPLRPAGNGKFVSPNGQVVDEPLQDPTIGRDPDNGEFEDMPLENEPAVPLPDTGGGMGGPSDVVGEFVQSGDSDAPAGAVRRESERQAAKSSRDTPGLRLLDSRIRAARGDELDTSDAKYGADEINELNNLFGGGGKENV